MTEYRVPTTTKVTGMIAAHADLLEQHGISAGLHASRPAAGTVARYYFSTDTGVWARDNGSTWDELISGLTEAYIQGLIDSSINTHAGVADAHHARYSDAEAEAAVKAGVEMGDLKTPTKDIPAGGQKITGVATPTALTGAATKGYVDSKIQGLDWQNSVLGELAEPPVSPVEGDRYIVIATATGDWAEQEKNIAEWNGTSWDFTIPNEGFALRVEDTDTQLVFNGTAWVTFGSTVNHANLTNVLPDQHHTKYTDTEAESVASGLIATHEADPDVHHPAPTYDGPNKEVVFQI